MQLTKAFEQGVCVVAMLTTQIPDIPIASSTIHQRLGASPTYTQKIVRKLVVSGLATSVSGQGGGFRLARSPHDISCLDVVEAIEGEIVSFPDSRLLHKAFANSDGLTALTAANTVVHRIFAKADDHWRQILADVSIADIVHDSLAGDPLPYVNWNEM